MSDLQSKSNFELNTLIAIIENPKLADHPEHLIKECENGKALFEWDEEFSDDYNRQEYYDYTGRWAYMGPINQREMISIESHGHGSNVLIYGYTSSGKVSVLIERDLQLRGFAICYLMMKEAE